MMVNTHFSLSDDSCKAILSKYLDFDVHDFVAYIDKYDFDDVLLLSSKSKGIRMIFNDDKIKEILIDLFNKDCDTKIDNINVYIINNTKKKQKICFNRLRYIQRMS